MFLIAADASWENLWGYAHIAKMAIGLGMVIFVHELGHFLAAKSCGVKCEKFYVGFDIPMPKIGPFQIPSKIFHFRWGETEYGLGILPLGGYVKMLGQDDNPANAEKEAEKTRVAKEDKAATNEDHHKSITDVDLEPQPLAEDVDYELDPRSYTAKNVPQRMLIISAGVIMNVIFAFVFATIAYRIGVPYTPSIVGSTTPGGPAWRANVPLGYKILEVGDKGGPREHLRFRQDFTQDVILDGKKGDIRLLMRNELDESKPTMEISLTPDMRDAGWLLGELPYIGVSPPLTLELAEDPLRDGFPAAETSLQGGDVFVAGSAGGVRTEFANYYELHTFLAQHVDDEITLHVERRTENDEGAKTTTIQSVNMRRTPLRRLGIVMTMGPVSAVQKGSIAEQAGVQVGDVLQSIRSASQESKTLNDPVTAPQIIRRLAGMPCTLVVSRGGKPVELKLTPGQVRTYRSGTQLLEPMLVDSLGLTYEIKNVISNVEDQGDAKGRLRAGDEVIRVSVVPGSDSSDDRSALKAAGMLGTEWNLKKPEASWTNVEIDLTQWLPKEGKIRVRVNRNGQDFTADLSPYDSEEYSFAARGMLLNPEEDIHTAANWGEACSLGLRETKESLFLVVKFLNRLITGDVPFTGLGGPITIIRAASSEASVGTSRLLIFLTILSANLAIVNFLPIPVLDGGHMVFLLYEGIFRRPVNEAWQIRLSLMGFAFLLCLMAFVIGLDIVRSAGLG